MESFRNVVLAGALLALTCSCASQQSQEQKTAAPQAEFRTTATVKDIMDALVDPGSDYIWDSVETTVSAKGVEEKAPHTDEEWKQVRNHAIMLLEATNLLQMPGRHVAQAGEKADDPKVELAPEQIETLINNDRASLDQVCAWSPRCHVGSAERRPTRRTKTNYWMWATASTKPVKNAISNTGIRMNSRPESAPSERKGSN